MIDEANKALDEYIADWISVVDEHVKEYEKGNPDDKDGPDDSGDDDSDGDDDGPGVKAAGSDVEKAGPLVIDPDDDTGVRTAARNVDNAVKDFPSAGGGREIRIARAALVT